MISIKNVIRQFLLFTCCFSQSHIQALTIYWSVHCKPEDKSIIFMPSTSHQLGYSQVSRQHKLFLGSAVIFVRFASSLVQNKDCEMRVIFSDSKGGQPLWGCHTLPPLTARCFHWLLCLGLPSSVLHVSTRTCVREREQEGFENPDLSKHRPASPSALLACMCRGGGIVTALPF